MRKQPTPEDLGLAAQLLYSPMAEQTSNCNLADSRPKSNSTVRRVCHSQSERLRAYERGKARLRRRNLSAQQFQREIQKLTARLQF